MGSKKRVIFISIDGDGFIYKTNYNNRYVGEVFLEEIIKKYPFLFTASVSVGDIFKYPQEFNTNLIKKIFSLENVEAASHSWSHPHDWRSPDVDIKHEIFDSVDFINKYLLPPPKKVKIFLWTGLCNPTQECLSMVKHLGIENLNGFGDKNKAFIKMGNQFHFISKTDMDFTYMGLENLRKRLNTNKYYDILYSYKGQLEGLKKIVEYYKFNSHLPVHLWIHWYSAVRQDSLDALKYVLDWCLTQSLQPVFASEYVKIIAKGKVAWKTN